MSRARDFADLAGSANAGGITGRNLVINGAQNVAQRSASVTGLGATDGYFTLDRFKVAFGAASAGRFTMSQSTVTDLAGFSNALKLDCTTIDTSIAAGELFVLQHILEGFNLQKLKASSTSTQAFTLSFYAKSNASRAIATEFEFTNGTNRQISKLHTIGTSWARYTMTVPAASSTQVDDDNSAELTMNFWLYAGSTYTSGTINDDALAPTTSANRAPGIGSLFASTDNTLEITGVQLEVGQAATPFEHRSYGDELARCQRYYYKISVDTQYDTFMVADNDTTTTANGTNSFPVTMRASPTALETSGTAAHYEVRTASSSVACNDVPTLIRTTTNTAYTHFITANVLTAGNASTFRAANISAYLAWSAEL